MATAASSVSLASPSLPRTAAETRPILGPRWRSLSFSSRPVSASPLPLRSSLPPRAASVGGPVLADVAEGDAAARPSPPPPPSLPFRVGHGFDLHRLEPGLPLIIGGVDIPHDRGCEAHSDGDVLLHCVVDAILGALGLPDIGQIFPDSDPKWRGAASSVFLKEANILLTKAVQQLLTIAKQSQNNTLKDDKTVVLLNSFSKVKLMHEAGYELGNIDATLILQKPKLSPHKETIRANLCNLLGAHPSVVNIKAKTHEKVDSLGENRSIAAHTVVLLMRK